MRLAVNARDKGGDGFIRGPSLQLVVGAFVFLALEAFEVGGGGNQFGGVVVSFCLVCKEGGPFGWFHVLVGDGGKGSGVGEAAKQFRGQVGHDAFHASEVEMGKGRVGPFAHNVVIFGVYNGKIVHGDFEVGS